jgi:hypothetical protein
MPEDQAFAERAAPADRLCTGCGQPAAYAILLAGEPKRWYLPNQNVRELTNRFPELLTEVWFCRVCMRKLEDNFRATLLYLQAKAKRPSRPKRSQEPPTS